MSASKVELSELKEWLTNEVKLERYFEKLTNYGFSSLSLIQNLGESDLDLVGITPPYHRKRMLKFCKDLQMKQSPHENKECSQTGNETSSSNQPPSPERNEVSEHDYDHSNEETEYEPPPLPPKVGSSGVSKPKPVVPDRDSSLPRQQLDYNTESNATTTPATDDSSKTMHNEPDFASKPLGLESKITSSNERRDVTKTPKKPPPIPPRSDLESEQLVSSEARGGKVDENNEQSDLIQDIGRSAELKPKMSQSAPKPTPRRRLDKPERKSRDNQSVHTDSTEETNGENVQVKDTALHREGESAPEDKEIGIQSEVDHEPIYGNQEECQQPVVAPVKEVEKPANKKPLPLPRQKLSERNQDIRHSIAVPGQSANSSDEEEKGNSKSKLTKSLHRPNKFVPVVSDHGTFKTPSLLKECTRTSTIFKPSEVKSADHDEQVTYEVVGAGIEKGTYEDVQMPINKNHPEGQEDIYETVNDYDESKPVKGNNDGGVEPTKKKEPDGDLADIIYDYESDESTEGLLLPEPPELPEERKPRGESTDLFDGKQPKSGTPKSRKTCGYLFKQGGQQNNKGWKKRWFVFDGKELRYYRSETVNSPPFPSRLS